MTHFCDACYLCMVYLMTLVTSSDYIALIKFMTLYIRLYMVQIMNI